VSHLSDPSLPASNYKNKKTIRTQPSTRESDMQKSAQQSSNQSIHTHPSNGLLSGTTRCHMKVCACSRQTTTPAPHHSVFTGRMPFLSPNQKCQSTEGTISQTINHAMRHEMLSIIVYYGMTKCRPTTWSKKAIHLVRETSNCRK